MKRVRWFLIAAGLVACGGTTTDGIGGDEGPDTSTPPADAVDTPPTADATPDARDFAGMEFAVCTPGDRKGQCSEDNRGEVVCNEEGTGYVSRPCGDDSLCLDPAVGCTACRPANRKCKDDDVVLRCDEEGSGYVEVQDCKGAETGQVCLNGACAKLCDINSKTGSYIGCEYWGADLDNAMVPGGETGFYDAAGAQYAIVVSNTSLKYPATVEIFNNAGMVANDAQGNPLPTDPIPPMGLRIFNLPRRDVESTVLAPLAYRVVGSIPITAYQFNPLENVNVFSNDASILLPSHVLGRWYVVMTREQTFQELKGYLTVIAVWPGDTQVTVTVTAPTLANNGIKHMEPGESRSFMMKQFDVLNLETDAYGADLTGSVVLANHPIAVFGGSEASNAPNTTHCCPGGDCYDPPHEFNQPWLDCKERDDCLCEWPHVNLDPPQDVKCRTNWDCIKYNTCCADHLEMQLFPVKTWGREYVATHTYPRGKEKESWRILAAEDATTLTTYPSQLNVPVLNANDWIDFESAEHFEIHAKKPILVGQFTHAQDAPDPNVGGIKHPYDAATGDPSFLLAVPVEQFRTEYVFLAPNKYKFDAVNIVVPAGMPVFLDGKELKQEDLTFRQAKDILAEMKELKLEHPADLGLAFGDYALIGSGKWAVWRVAVSDGVHVAQAEKPFGVISYGYDQYVSYGYPAGLNLEDLKLVGDVP
ncbi:MAG: IgGFc-binding protein [Deltaproteobacteria bacterium]|nr:IgGFc-binding protein [Deltaproteobacteria bacterium]